MKRIQPSRGARGFTLLELVIVLIILGTIMAFLAPRIFGNVGKANQALAKAKMEQLSGQLEILRLEVGRYPNASEGLKALVDKPAGMDKWNGPYVKDQTTLKDPWGNDFRYNQPGRDNRPFEIVTLGADGKEGGEGEDKDLVN
ncbi:Type II secretion system protein G [Usitatibacter rugosus]|uniref:Type II secretion system core protein G n=1 Tax=Usitatibacter rugosus TaxID=2732067 RepID=A0A6M4H1Y1_9PROT|nr:type II secretion system major pseudopilin GspG [Usitatibacter rugosus]QJR12713.1 Type II secretion system protein G [Usitatibacter rugosus]